MHIFGSTVGLANVSGYLRLHTLSGYDGSVTGVAFHPEGAIVASAESDGTARLWDLETGEQLNTLIDQPVALEGVDISPDGRYVVTAGDDGMLHIFLTSAEDLMDLARSRLSRSITNAE